MSRRHLIPLACALAALTAGGAGVVESLRTQHWDTTALVRINDLLPVASLAKHDDPAFRIRQDTGFYDGAYFYAIARDPLATGEAHRLLPEAPYYWGHPAYGWLAWLASGGGRPDAVPDALLFVGLVAIFVAGGAASLLAKAAGWSPWGGLAVALNPGLVFAVNADTSESVGAAVLLLGLLAYIRGRRGWAIGLFAALCLVKEPLVLVPLAIGAWELWRRRSPLIAAAVVPAVVWWVYVRIHLGAFPFGQGSERLAAPLTGWTAAFAAAASQSWAASEDTTQLGQAAVPLIIVVALAIVIGAVYALRLRSVVQPAFLALAALYACITESGVLYPKDLMRELALVLTLLPFAIAARATPSEQVSAGTRPRAPRLSPLRRGS
ncbi:MAG TPA: hypothetical protein VII51_01865 [Gaiellaceae bacterium]